MHGILYETKEPTRFRYACLREGAITTVHHRIQESGSKLYEELRRIGRRMPRSRVPASETAVLRQQITALENRLDRLTAHAAPVLWQDIGRGPLAPLPTVLAHVEAAVGTNHHDQGEELARRARSGEIGTRAAAPLIAALSPGELHEHAVNDAAPLPHPDDRVRYGGDDHLAYWLSGLSDALYVGLLAEEYGSPLGPGTSFLDFGCASGRVLRHVERLKPQVAIWGADLSIAPLVWAREHLPHAFGLCRQR